MIELLILCVLYAVVWGIVVPIVEHACLGVIYLLLLTLFMYAALARKDCNELKMTGLSIYKRLYQRA